MQSSTFAAEVRPGIALCLSGGGYRAMLFHVGVLWRLYELDWLRRLTRISSVSGGSITAAMLGLRFGQLRFEPAQVRADFVPKVVEPIRSLAATTIDVGAVLGGVLWFGSVSSRPPTCSPRRCGASASRTCATTGSARCATRRSSWRWRSRPPRPSRRCCRRRGSISIPPTSFPAAATTCSANRSRASDIADYGLADAFDCPPERTRALADVPTRLAALEPAVLERLINWGYAVCAAAVRRFVVIGQPRPAGLPYSGAGV